ncbi:cofilin [Linnemannia elongata]|nr:cofilin [Linnemannia elongata]
MLVLVECMRLSRHVAHFASTATSGVKVLEKCIDTFQELKLGKTLKYIIYKVSDDLKSIEVVKQSDDADYDNFLTELPTDDCRWAIYDFAFKTSDGGDRNKIVFYSWYVQSFSSLTRDDRNEMAPDNAKVKSKMLYSSSKEALRKALNGIAVEIQGTDFDEVSHDTVLEKVRR